MRRKHKTKRPRKGMALLVVLFIVMAIAIISSGFIARSDASLQAGRNFCLRSETDYLAWGGLEHAWALAQDPGSLTPYPFELTAQQLDAAGSQYYDVTIDTPDETLTGDPMNPSTFVYPVQVTAYTLSDGQTKATSTLQGKLFYDPGGSTYYISIRRQ